MASSYGRVCDPGCAEGYHDHACNSTKRVPRFGVPRFRTSPMDALETGIHSSAMETKADEDDISTVDVRWLQRCIKAFMRGADVILRWDPPGISPTSTSVSCVLGGPFKIDGLAEFIQRGINVPCIATLTEPASDPHAEWRLRVTVRARARVTLCDHLRAWCRSFNPDAIR